VFRYFWLGMIQPALLSLAFVIPAWIVHRVFHPTGWLPLALATGLPWLLFAGVVWRWGLDPRERQRWAQAVPRAFGVTRGTPRAAGAES
jgi:hypothetical protein